MKVANDSPKEVLRTAGDLLDARRIRSKRVRGRWSGHRFHIEYFTTSTESTVGRPEDRYYWVNVWQRWTEQRVNIRRRNELTKRRGLERLEKRLAELNTAQQAIVIQALTELAGPFSLGRSAMATQLPFMGTSGAELAERVKVTSRYLEQLANALPD